MSENDNWTVNPLSKHDIYVEGNMVNILKIVPINIYRVLDVVENVFIGANCSQYEIRQYTMFVKEFHDVFS